MEKCRIFFLYLIDKIYKFVTKIRFHKKKKKSNNHRLHNLDRVSGRKHWNGPSVKNVIKHGFIASITSLSS